MATYIKNNRSDSLITIYIVNKNYARFLEKSIKSALEQSYKNIELIIVDDNSNDNSKKIIEKYGKLKSVKFLFNKKSIGLIKSSNIAIKLAGGKYVLRIDADDYLDKNAILLMYNEIKKFNNTAIIFPDYYIVDKKSNILSHEKQLDYKKKFIEYKPILAAGCLIKKSCLLEVNLYDERFKNQDGYDLWYKIIKNYKIRHLPMPLFYYRRHSKNLTTDKKKIFRTRSKILKKFATQKLKNKKLSKICIIPVRGINMDKNCPSQQIVNGKPIYFYSIDSAIKTNIFDKIIFSTADNKILKKIKFKYKEKVVCHLRKKKFAYLHTDPKPSILEAIKKYNKKTPDVVVFFDISYPYKPIHYIEQAVNNLLLHESDMVISTIPDLENDYYTYTNSGIKLLSNERKDLLKLEKKIILKSAGGIKVYNYLAYKNDQINKTTNILIDQKSAKNFSRLNEQDFVKL